MADQFSFEKLDVYQRTLTFSKKVLTLTKEIKGQYSWCNQLNRAANRITLNLAGGLAGGTPRIKQISILFPVALLLNMFH